MPPQRHSDEGDLERREARCTAEAAGAYAQAVEAFAILAKNEVGTVL